MSKWKKWLQQSIAVVSVLALMAGMPPQMRAQAAEDAAGTAQEQTSEGAGATDENGEAFILGEDTTKRDENVKHFRMSDGSYTMVQYGTPVHYEKDGAWEDIDSTLSEGQESTAELAQIEGITTYAAQQPEEVYGIAGNSFDVKFAKKSNGKFLMKLKQEDASIYWSVVSPQKNKVTGQATNGAAQSDDPMSLTRLTSQMLYADIFQDTDLQYIVTPTGVKENIIVKKAQSAYVYTFELKVKGVTLSLEEDGSIAVRNADGSDRFVIPAPYMFDAAGEMSEAVHYELEAGKNGKTYTLSVVADEDWINAEGRQFPVTIDPAVKLERSYTNIHDRNVAFGTPTSSQINTMNDGWHHTKLLVGKYLTGIETGALVHTDVTELNNARIISAQMSLYYYTDNTTGMRINAYQVTGNWPKYNNDTDKYLLYGSQVPAYTNKIIDYSITPSTAAQGKCTTFDITKAVQDWVTYQGSNQGILLRANNWNEGLVKYIDSDNGDIKDQNGNVIASEDPVFIINYRDAKGIEPQWTYTSMSGGRAATAYVNNYNGELTVINADAGVDGNRLPLSVYHVYNDSTKSWKTNYELFMMHETTLAELKDDYPYYLTDMDGTDHYFYLKDGKYVDEDGLGYTLEVIRSTTEGLYKLTDKDGGRIYFNWNGQPDVFYDSVGNRNKVFYQDDGSGDNFARIYFVRDGAERAYIYGYTGASQMTSLTAPDGMVSFGLGTGGRLNSVTYPGDSSASTVYSYNGRNQPTRITGLDGCYVEIAYTTAEPYRVQSLAYKNASGTALESE